MRFIISSNVVYTTFNHRRPEPVDNHVVKGNEMDKMTQVTLKQGDSLDASWLRELCIKVGADYVGFVQIDHPELTTDRDDIRMAAPWTKTLISLVVRMNRENIRSPLRSLVNIEFHASDDQVTNTSREIVRTLE